LIVIGNNLRHRDAVGVDFPVDQKARHSGGLGLAHRRDGRIGAGVIQNDGRHAVGNRGIEQLVLFVSVVVVRVDQHVVAELLPARGGAVRFGFEKRVLV
jgi:hypothetical protein